MQRIFVGCLPGDTNSRELAKILGRYARLKKVSLVLDDINPHRTYCKGYGFAICESREEAAKLVAQDAKVTYKNRVLALREFKSGSKLSRDRAMFNKRRIFIGNIPIHGDESSLKQVLERFGQVDKIFFVSTDEPSNGKFGYAVFGSVEDAQKLLKSGEVIKYKGRKLRIEQFIPEEGSEDGKLPSSEKKSASKTPFGQKVKGTSQKSHENRLAEKMQSAVYPKANLEIEPLDSNSSQEQPLAPQPNVSVSKVPLAQLKEEITQLKPHFKSFSKKISMIVCQNHFNGNIRINIGLQGHPKLLHSNYFEQENQPIGWQGSSETTTFTNWRQIHPEMQ